jgi:hypothetical protein
VTTLYLADVGFRPAGVRLAWPVRVVLGERKLTLDELIATPAGTELTYYVSGLNGDEGYTSKQDVVAIRAGSTEQVLARGSFSFGTDPAGLRRRLSSASVISQATGPIELTIAIDGVGEFRLAAALRPFGPETDAPRLDVNTSAMYEGITVTVRGIGAARDETAVEVELSRDRRIFRSSARSDGPHAPRRERTRLRGALAAAGSRRRRDARAVRAVASGRARARAHRSLHLCGGARDERAASAACHEPR